MSEAHENLKKLQEVQGVYVPNLEMAVALRDVILTEKLLKPQLVKKKRALGNEDFRTAELHIMNAFLQLLKEDFSACQKELIWYGEIYAKGKQGTMT